MRTFQFYAGTVRGSRLLYEVNPKTGEVESREHLFTDKEVEQGKRLAEQFPVFKTVFDDYQRYNDGLVKYMKDTGVISDAEAKEWTKNWDYIPFYRQMDGEETVGPRLFYAVGGVKQGKKLKGGALEERPIGDFLETIIRNTQSSINAGMKNAAAQPPGSSSAFSAARERGAITPMRSLSETSVCPNC